MEKERPTIEGLGIVTPTKKMQKEDAKAFATLGNVHPVLDAILPANEKGLSRQERKWLKKRSPRAQGEGWIEDQFIQAKCIVRLQEQEIAEARKSFEADQAADCSVGGRVFKGKRRSDAEAKAIAKNKEGQDEFLRVRRCIHSCVGFWYAYVRRRGHSLPCSSRQHGWEGASSQRRYAQGRLS